MNTRKKYINFLLVIILFFGQIAVVHKLQSNVMDNIKQIQDIEKPLELMSQEIIGYDDVFTAQVFGAVLEAQVGNYENIDEYRSKYDKFESVYDSVVQKEAKILLTQSTRSQNIKDAVTENIDIINEASTKLTVLETEIFEAIAKKDMDKAYSLAIGVDYKKYKDIIYQNAKAWTDVEHQINLDMSKKLINDSQNIIFLNLIFSILIIITIISTLLSIRSSILPKKPNIIRKNKSR